MAKPGGICVSGTNLSLSTLDVWLRRLALAKSTIFSAHVAQTSVICSRSEGTKVGHALPPVRPRYVRSRCVHTYTELTLGADFNMVYGIASTTAAPLAVVPEIHHIWPTTLPKTGIARAPHDAGPYTHSSWREWENGGSHTHDLNPFAYLTTPASWTLGQCEPGSEWRHSPPGASRWRLRGASRRPCPVKPSVVGLGKFHLPRL